jgi:hypothetical protein
MIYNFEQAGEKQKALDYIELLNKTLSKVEITRKAKKRSNNVNRYQHLLFSFFALEYGETADYVKQFIYKEYVNPEIFVIERTNPKNGKTRKDIRSTKDLDSKETTDAIEKFRNWSSKTAGIYLPSSDEQGFLDNIDNLISQNKQYL